MSRDIIGCWCLQCAQLHNCFLNAALRQLLPPNVNLKTHKYWQAGYSLPLPSPGSDCWPWWTCHVCPWPRVHGTFTARWSLLWRQWSAILQTKSSKRTCHWSSYPRQPRAAASHDLLLFDGWVDLQWTQGWPLWTVWVLFLFLSVWVFWTGINMIISGHAGSDC